MQSRRSFILKKNLPTFLFIHEAIFCWWYFLFFMPGAAAAAKSLQSCPTLCDPIDDSPLGSLVPGILQARTLEWVAISFSNAWKWTVKVKSLSRVRLLATPWTAAYQAPPPTGFSRQEYWSGVPSPSPIPSRTDTKKDVLFIIEGWNTKVGSQEIPGVTGIWSPLC